MFLWLELWARRLVVGVGALAAVAGSLVPTGAQAETPILSPTAWCTLVDPPVVADVARAESVMNGKVDLGKFGSYSLAEDPDWGYQSTTDLAGNRGINSLDWLSPVIQQGLAKNDQKMLARARALIYSWSAARPVTRPFGDSDQPLIAGKRLIALNCAGELLSDPVIKGIATAESARAVAMISSWGAVNNTDLNGYAGLLFNACFTGDEIQKQAMTQQLNKVAQMLVNRDGSDTEGSPAYANYTAMLMSQAITIMDACNVNSDILSSRRDELLKFVAYTIRPDFVWETLGDSTTERLARYANAPTSPLYWAASKGGTGIAPVETYSIYPVGGYLFARSGWMPTSTFYSLRARPQGLMSPHVHDDATSFTLFSQGVQWIADPGPYRYDDSAIRKNIVKRMAHSSLEVQGIRTVSKGGFVKTSTTPESDTTCVRDNPTSQITMTRCVQYVRTTDTFVISDRLIDRRKARSPKATWIQRWQIPPGVIVSTLAGSNGFALSSGSASLHLTTDANARLTLVPGGTSGLGLFTAKYGELLPGNTISRRFESRGRSDVTVVTTLKPGSVSTQTSG